MIKVQTKFPEKGNAYLLFGFEAIQARPNLDPYTGTLRVNEASRQVFITDVSMKHHVRRGVKAYAAALGIPHAEETIFYEKVDENGEWNTLDQRLEKIRNVFEIKKPEVRDALNYTLDLPLFGYVQASKKNSKKEYKNYNVTNAANTLFRPATFHSCEIYPLGRNNAFPGEKKGKKGEENEEAETNSASGSACVDSLEYGFFLGLWEINLNMLRINAAGHRLVNWEKEGAAKWFEILVNGMWRAYSSDRYPSFTQRSQFAQFVLGWIPEEEPVYTNPAALYEKLSQKRVKTHSEAVAALEEQLPGFLADWKCKEKNVFVQHRAANFPVVLPGAEA